MKLCRLLDRADGRATLCEAAASRDRRAPLRATALGSGDTDTTDPAASCQLLPATPPVGRLGSREPGRHENG